VRETVQINPSKTRQKFLDLLGLIRPNRDFSKGCERKNNKNRLASQVVGKASQGIRTLSISLQPAFSRWAIHPANGNMFNMISTFRKENVGADRIGGGSRCRSVIPITARREKFTMN
jgi:hypothetical protein